MSTKHTPGPLKVFPSNQWPFNINICNESGDVVDVIRLPAHSTKHRNFYEALSFHGADHSEAEFCREANLRALADAHLRAAAPELLEALQRIEKRIAYYASMAAGDAPNIEQWAYTDQSGDMAIVRAAIAKAIGEQA